MLNLLLWLAAGSLEGLNTNKCRALNGRTVLMFPDMDGLPKWQEKARELNNRMPDAHFRVSDFLHRNVFPADRRPGMDIADLYVDDWERAKALEREWGLRE